ncbi:hypothetical protein NDR87_02745 [Nocardia sp. CDC159]|uniref:Uncharacterized protein n=1 Tax=Nocardia pulmonis TaxID=2951408 RepID=A0A9X2E1E6_9NOCA|nr:MULTISPECIES: hypothetical protein [Nocardia]MCM6772069.1 hypothetical protein [Nocardia pulmonis]MCM6785273.1 hypothetical protein [Nocardia sp. CDC159]
MPGNEAARAEPGGVREPGGQGGVPLEPEAPGDAAPQLPPTAPSGSAGGPLAVPATGSFEMERPLSLQPRDAVRPVVPPAAQGQVDRGENAVAAADSAAGDTALSGLDSGSWLAACASGAVLAGSAMATGSVTGSALLIPALYIGAFGSAFVLGSGVFAPAGLAGSVLAGAPGSVYGSSALGSAMAGSSALACLMAVPTPPPVPEFPLGLPPLPLGPVGTPVGAPVAPAGVPGAPPVPLPPAQLPLSPVAGGAEPTTPLPAWGTIEFITVLIVVVVLGSLGTATTSSGSSGKRPRY